jgi:hypothetical protein
VAGTTPATSNMENEGSVLEFMTKIVKPGWWSRFIFEP